MRGTAAWRESDLTRAIHAADRDAIEDTESIRALVLELLVDERPRDLFSACAQLGRMMHAAGASPTLVAGVMDGANAALGANVDPTRLGAARASVAEGYVAAALDAERQAARQAWEYPACAVRIGERRVAIACGLSTGDPEMLAEWSARVALAASKAGIRHAVLSGPEATRTELGAALALVGIAWTSEGESEAAPSRWSWRPWRK